MELDSLILQFNENNQNVQKANRRTRKARQFWMSFPAVGSLFRLRLTVQPNTEIKSDKEINSRCKYKCAEQRSHFFKKILSSQNISHIMQYEFTPTKKIHGKMFCDGSSFNMPNTSEIILKVTCENGE